jgi:hypothetical protein
MSWNYNHEMRREWELYQQRKEREARENGKLKAAAPDNDVETRGSNDEKEPRRFITEWS